MRNVVARWAPICWTATITHRERVPITLSIRRFGRESGIRHFLALEDLVYVVFEGEHSNPNDWLVHDVVGADASRRGLGRMVGRLRKRFEPLAECRERVLGEYKVIFEVHEGFKASQSDVASVLWTNIKQHIERLEPADMD